MKRVNNRQVMELFVERVNTDFWRAPYEVESHTGHLSYCGNNAYTYGTILAHLTLDSNKQDVLYVNCTRYSQTSTRHLSDLLRALRETGVRVVKLTGLPRGASEWTLMRYVQAMEVVDYNV